MAQNDLDPVLMAAAARTDALRAAGLAGLAGVTEARQAGLGRERARLARVLGSTHPRVEAMAERVRDGVGRLRDLRVEVSRAKTVAPQVGVAGWAVHGHVRTAEWTPAPGLTVLLIDSGGRWQRALGFACSDEDGYFRLVSPGEGANLAPTVSLRVLGPDRAELYRSPEALQVTAGAVEYREIVLGETGPRCAPPEDDFTVTAKPGPTSSPAPTPANAPAESRAATTAKRPRRKG